MRFSGPLPSLALSFLLIGSAGLPGFSASPPAQSPIMLMAMTELQAGNGGHYVVTAQINKSDVSVLVDTGATVVALSYEDAQ